jgi:hypothetical protein
LIVHYAVHDSEPVVIVKTFDVLSGWRLEEDV